MDTKELRARVIREAKMTEYFKNGKNEIFTYCKGKAKGHFKDIDNTSDATLESSFLAWREWKKRTFSPAEHAALASDGNVKDALLNTFVDYGELIPRKIAIIIVPQNKQAKAIGYAEDVDVIGGSNAFTVGLSEDGEEPATHYLSVWNCSGRAYLYFEEIAGKNDWDLWDGVMTSWQDVLTSEGLQVIPNA